MQPKHDSATESPEDPLTRSLPRVAALERGLAVLDAFLGPAACRSLAELTRATGLPKSNVLRSLGSLKRVGHVVRLATGRYQLGAKVMLLGDAYRANFRLEDHVLPALRAMAETTGESAAFQIREQDNQLTLFRVESQQPVRDVLSFTTSLPLGATAAGMVLTLSHWDEEIARGHPRVYATAGLFNAQTASLATAVFGAEGRLMGSLTVSGPIERMLNADQATRARQMAQAATRLSLALGAPLRLERPDPELIRG